MKTMIQKISKQVYILLFIVIVPVAAFAEHLPSAAEEVAHSNQMAFWGEIGIGVLFAAALTAFLIYKTKHDKKLREKHLEQMKKVQANKRRAA